MYTMPLNETQTFAIVGILLGLAFVGALFTPLVVSGYVPELDDWQYMRIAHVTVPSSVVGRLVFIRFPLPDIDASDVNSIRVTIGSGSNERLLTSWVRGSYIYVQLVPPSRQFDLRVYYGNPSAEPTEPLFTSDRVYRAPPFSESDYLIRYCDDDWHGNMDFRRSYVYLAHWDDDCASMTLTSRVSSGAYIDMKLRGGGWGSATVYVLLSDEDISPDSTPEDAVVISVRDDGKVYVALQKDGRVVNETARRRNRDFHVRFYPYGGGYHVYVGSAYLGDISFTGEYLSFITAKGDADIRLRGLVVGYDVVTASVEYSDQILAPKAPSVTLEPSDGSVVTSPVHLSVSVSDPNNDLARLTVAVDGDVVYDGNAYTFSADLDLSDGNHVVVATVVDSEDITVTQSSHFTVDTRPPVLDLNYSYESGVLHVDVNASDLTLSACYYVHDQNTFDIPCNASIDINDASGIYTFCAVDAVGHTTCRDVEVRSQTSPPAGSGSAGAGSGSAGSTSAVRTVYVSSPYVTEVSMPVSSSAPSSLSIVSMRYVSIFGLLLVLLFIASRIAL